MFDSHKVPVEIWMQIIDGINGLPHSEEVHYGFLRLLGRLDLMAYSKRRACGMVYNMLFRRLPSLRFTIQGDGDVDLSRHERAFYSNNLRDVSIFSPKQSDSSDDLLFWPRMQNMKQGYPVKCFSNREDPIGLSKVSFERHDPELPRIP